MMAAMAAIRPGGKVTEVFTEEAEREGAYRFLESESLAAVEIGKAAHRATAQRSRGLPFVYVPTDQTDLRVVDRSDSKGLGSIGDGKTQARGLQVMNSIAVSPEGVPLGMCGQAYWARRGNEGSKGKNDRRPWTEKETRYWIEAMEQTRTAFVEAAGGTRPWYQLDRGGDGWPMFLQAKFRDEWVTIRATHDRRLQSLVTGEQGSLWGHMERQEPLGSYELRVPGGLKRKARQAVMQLQACPVTLDVQLYPSTERMAMALWAVRAVEVGTAPRGEEPIEWLLLTTYPVHGHKEAVEVLLGYSTRWRIEEFHKTWKSGACRVEETQLQDGEAIERWATILASVAMRIQRLMHLSRAQPDMPASAELTKHEVEAVIVLRRPRGVARTAKPTLAEVVRWIADLGGYTGKSSGGPPGAIVLARGLDYIRSAVHLLSVEKL